jgi:hypothetical protein
MAADNPKYNYVNYYGSTNTEDKHHYLLHRYIMNNPINQVVDHKDGNTLNNRKYNLRICSRSDNCKNNKLSKRNSSGAKGVYWEKRLEKWMAAIVSNRKFKNLGYYDDFEEAVKARKNAEEQYFGEFIREEQYL